MKYEEIKKIIENDYNDVQQVRMMKGGRGGTKTFYMNFSKALDELHLAVGPFVTNTEQFVEYLKHIKERLTPPVYEIIVDYCKNKLKLDIGE